MKIGIFGEQCNNLKKNQKRTIHDDVRELEIIVLL